MNPIARRELARTALPFIASYCGAQETLSGPPIQLWTLRATLSAELVAGSTVAEETVLGWLAARTTAERPTPGELKAKARIAKPDRDAPTRAQQARAKVALYVAAQQGGLGPSRPRGVCGGDERGPQASTALD